MIDLAFLLVVVAVAAAVVRPFVGTLRADRRPSHGAAPTPGPVEAPGPGPAAPRPGGACRQPVSTRVPAGTGRGGEPAVMASRACGTPGSLGSHPLGAPDWAGRTACPCGLVRVYPPGTAALPAEPQPVTPFEDMADRAPHPHRARRGSLASHRNTEPSARRPPNPNRQHLGPDGPSAVVFDLDEARRIKRSGVREPAG